MSQSTPSQQNNLQHIAIIMDGNSRWAKNRGFAHLRGHSAGVERIRDMLSVCRDQHIKALTLFAFSSENWQRPQREVNALMDLFHQYLRKESPRLQEEGVRLRVIGGRQRFSEKILAAIHYAEDLTRDGTSHLVIAADYGGKWDIANACQQVTQQVVAGEIAVEQIDANLLEKYLCLSDLPPVDLLIRTGDELRISNFLLWQAAYAELYFSTKMWPDFDDKDLHAAIEEFYRRQRRFGLTGEQLRGNSRDENRNSANGFAIGDAGNA